MGKEGDEALGTRQGAPLFMLSFRQRDELAAAAEAAGWRTIAARRAEGVERRFIVSGAAVAVVDARGALAEGLAAIKALADPVEANAGALLVLLSRNDVSALDAIFAAGATHYLASPFGDAEFAQTLRFAERLADRLAGGGQAGDGTRLGLDDMLGWHYHPVGGLRIGAPLRERLALPPERPISLTYFYRLLGVEGREAARGAARRLRAGSRATAFAHDMPEPSGERVAHHLHLDLSGIGVAGSIETLDTLGELDERPERGHRDSLTGLRDGVATRRWIEARLKAAGPVTLLLLSISRFDMINAAFGRATGDALLRSVARRIEALASASAGRRALVARIAGAEFAVGLDHDVTEDKARFLAEELSRSIARPFISGAQMVPLACRIGMAISGAGEDDATILLRRASAALAEAQATESGAVHVISGANPGDVALHGRLQIDLRRALNQGEVDIVFQPQVSVTTGAIVGVEALARWNHPDLGELGAVTLFAAAERSDYVAQLSEHVQRRAVAIAASWPAALSELRLSINVTAADIAVPGFVERLLTMVDDSGFPRGRLTVEITESGLIRDLGDAAALLAELREAGCRVAIDDFGTGYSSLAYLKALPLDYLKIDKKLAEDITGSTRDRIVVRGVIEMARSLGLAVIAEGVESEEQLALLAREGCNYYQGYLCSEPVDSERLSNLVMRA